MTIALSILAGAFQQFFDNSGRPLTGGKLYSYEAGTNTPAVTYSSFAAIPHTNPIILDSAGRIPSGEIWVATNASFKFRLTDSKDSQLATWDNITAVSGTERNDVMGFGVLSIQPTYPIFTDIDGQPLADGYIYIGAAGFDPQTNPINVYWDAALTLPAAQPIRTLAGYPANSGTPARLYVNSDYSIRVMNKNGSAVYSAPAATERYNGSVISFGASTATGNGAQTVFAVSGFPAQIFINGVYQNQNTYTVAGGSVTFSEAPPSNSKIEFVI